MFIKFPSGNTVNFDYVIKIEMIEAEKKTYQVNCWLAHIDDVIPSISFEGTKEECENVKCGIDYFLRTKSIPTDNN